MTESTTGEPKPSDSTIYRLAKGTGFNARVEPIWHNLSRIRKTIGWIQYVRDKSKLKKLIGRVSEHFKEINVAADGWDTTQGKCVVNLRVEKLGVLEDLRTFVKQDSSGRLAAKAGHLLNHRERNAYYLPVDFEKPFVVDQDGDKIPFGSSVRLRQELEAIDQVLCSSDSLAADKMVNYLHASETDISRFESKVLMDPLFWTKFGYVLLMKLARSSAESGLPIIFA